MAGDIRDLFGIELPVVQAPMAGVQGAALAVAVSEAGGLGSLPCALLDPETLAAELAFIREQTRRPFNVNFFCHAMPDEGRGDDPRWRDLLQPYYQEWGLEMGRAPTGALRRPFDEATAALVEPFRPPVVSFHFGLPHEALLARVRAWGARILSTATTPEEAEWLEQRGVDAIVLQGLEAGGHRGHFLRSGLEGQAALFDLLPRVAERVRVPVIAAGGIADAADVRRALDLGAAGVQVGTAYLLCDEATTSPVHRRTLEAGDAPTAITNLFSGRPARAIVNRAMRELGPMIDAAPPFPLAARLMGPLRSAAEKQGLGDFSPLWAGERYRACRSLSAAELTRALAAEA
ncbi:MAG: nitronate monooxygenase [Gammaproteobacteria bacterium]